LWALRPASRDSRHHYRWGGVQDPETFRQPAQSRHRKCPRVRTALPSVASRGRRRRACDLPQRAEKGAMFGWWRGGGWHKWTQISPVVRCTTCRSQTDATVKGGDWSGNLIALGHWSGPIRPTTVTTPPLSHAQRHLGVRRKHDHRLRWHRDPHSPSRDLPIGV